MWKIYLFSLYFMHARHRKRQIKKAWGSLQTRQAFFILIFDAEKFTLVGGKLL